MPRLFVSYAHRDAALARALVDALEAAGHQVWWDQRLAGGARFRDVIEQQLDAADVVLVLWSPHARHSRYVLDEAERAGRSGKLLSLLLNDEPPLGFGALQGVDIAAWQGGTDDATWGRILAGIAGVAAARPGAPPVLPPPQAWWRHAVHPALAAGLLLGTALWMTQAPPAAGGHPALLGWPLLDAWAVGIVAATPVALLAAREATDLGLHGWRPATRRMLLWFARAVTAALVVTALAAVGGAFPAQRAVAGGPGPIADMARATLLLTLSMAALVTAGTLAWRLTRHLLGHTSPR